jgi:hypothetical protein
MTAPFLTEHQRQRGSTTQCGREGLLQAAVADGHLSIEGAPAQDEKITAPPRRYDRSASSIPV